MPSSEWPLTYGWRSSSSAELHGMNTDADLFNFLTFLTVAQTLGIQFLNIVWDSGREVIGTGGTSTIHQSLLDLDNSFAFKTYYKQNRTEENIFRTLITEITVLTQVFVREHPNIAQLQGICWDISHKDDKPWPVLVFEKSHLGDLCHFARYGGRDMTIHERLGLCVGVGRAIMDMHNNSIVHGDVKPDNVLVFKDKSGSYTARVTDFGFSTQYLHEGQKLLLPRSEPWNAPENNGRQRLWTLSEALKADIFSFGMLVFWLLFEASLYGTTPQPHDQMLDKGIRRLQGIKSDIRRHAQQYSLSATQLNDSQMMALLSFFESSLDQSPDQRDCACLQRFLMEMDAEWLHAQTDKPVESPEDIIIYSSDFKIQRSIYQFYRADFRLRCHIAHLLLESQSRSADLAVQAAFCYEIGFGVARNHQKAKELLEGIQSFEAVQDAISYIDETGTEYSQATTMLDLDNKGVVRWSTFAEIYLEQNILEEAEARLHQEQHDLTAVIGTDHDLTTLVKYVLNGVYYIQSRWDKAEELGLELMNTYKEKQGADHLSTMASIGDLASIYRQQGRWEASEKLWTEHIKTSMRRFGEDHPSTLISTGNLAVTYQQQNRWDEAEKLQVGVIKTYKQTLGADHPHTLLTMVQLASTYRGQERYDMAEELALEAVQLSKLTLGDNHRDTMAGMTSLAVTYRAQRRLDLAENLALEVVEVQKKQLGMNHLQTLTSMANLASIYHSSSQLKAAESLGVEIVEALRRKLGTKHPSTLMAMTTLSVTHQHQEQWDLARELEFEILEVRQREMGSDHPYTRDSRMSLANIHLMQGRWDLAEELKLETIKIDKEKTGANHPDTLSNMVNFASEYRERERWHDAEKLELEVMQSRKQTLGALHPDTLDIMADLIEAWRVLNHWNKAEQLVKGMIDIYEQKVEPHHSKTIYGMAKLISTFWDQYRRVIGEKMKIQAFETNFQQLGAHHHDTLASMAELAAEYQIQSRWCLAEELGSKAMAACERELGMTHAVTLASMERLATSFRYRMRFEEAEKLGVKVLETHKQKSGASHPDTLRSMLNLASIYESIHWDLMEDLTVKVMEINKEIHGPDHLETMINAANLIYIYDAQEDWDASHKMWDLTINYCERLSAADYLDRLPRVDELARIIWNNLPKISWDIAERLHVEVHELQKQKLGGDHIEILISMGHLIWIFQHQGHSDAAKTLFEELLVTTKARLGEGQL